MKAWVSAIWGVVAGIGVGGAVAGTAWVGGAAFMSIREEEKREAQLREIKKFSDEIEEKNDLLAELRNEGGASLGAALKEQRLEFEIEAERNLKLQRQVTTERILEVFHELMAAETTEDRRLIYSNIEEFAKVEPLWNPILEIIPDRFDVSRPPLLTPAAE